MASGPIISWQIEEEKMEVVTDFLFLGSKITVHGNCNHKIRRWLLLGRKSMTNLDSVLKSRNITLPTKVLIVKATVFPVGRYGWAWKLYHKEGRAPKNWCPQSVVLVKISDCPLKSKDLQGNKIWILFGRTEAEAEAPVFWSSNANRWLTGKVPDAGKDWRQQKRATEDEMAGWHHQCNEHELGQILGDGEGQGSLICCSLWGHKESDTTGGLNNNKFWWPFWTLVGTQNLRFPPGMGE